LLQFDSDFETIRSKKTLRQKKLSQRISKQKRKTTATTKTTTPTTFRTFLSSATNLVTEIYNK
jgi:hypothetical protein